MAAAPNHVAEKQIRSFASDGVVRLQIQCGTHPGHGGGSLNCKYKIIQLNIAPGACRGITSGRGNAASPLLVGFAALFGWQIGGSVRRNSPRSYAFDHLPEALLP
jgi:hypothetical protein